MRRRPAILLIVLLLATAGAARAAPEDALLASLAAEFREPQRRCESLARDFDTITGRLSLYRHELASLVVAVDGATYADSASGGVQRLTFESRLFGPPSVAAVLDLRRIQSPERLKPGRRVEIHFVPAAAAARPLFCGHAVLVNLDSALQRADVVALTPRRGPELQSSATYSNVTDVDVLRSLAAQAGLTISVQDRYARPVQAQVPRTSEATWTFMRRLAERNALELVLRSDGVLAVTNSSFTAPPAAAVQTWTDLTWVEIATRIAAGLGRSTESRLTASFPRLRSQQGRADDDFLYTLANAQSVSAWFAPGRVILVDDRTWPANPESRTVADVVMTPLQLLARVGPDHGLAVQIPALTTRAVTVTQRAATDAEVLLRELGTNRLRLSASAAGLSAQAAAAPGDVTDLLLERITIAGSAAAQRTISRRYTPVRELLLAPERLAATEVVLDLGAALPAVRPAAFALADPGVIAVALDAAIARLAQTTAQTPERRLLQDLARLYRPTLIHLYRLQPDALPR
ncbi:MAG: hypothetical protein FJ191_08915 [Gammaproteobacteria bacterium]|nr:hypothetical protein [Gammaproteobacteria bacterium]